MKKIISTVAAFGLIAGFAATASALDVPDAPVATGKEVPAKPTAPDVGVFSLTGSYSVAGAYLSEGNGVGTGTSDRVATTSAPGEEEADDTFYFHSLILKPVIKVGDKLQLKIEFRLADRNIWGATDVMDPNGGSNSGRITDANRAWLEYMSPVGKLSIGRMPSGAWFHKFMNSGARKNRIIYDPNFLPKPLFAKFLMEKGNENDVANGNGIADQDNELYLLHVGAKMDIGTSVLGWFHRRNATAGTAGVEDVVNSDSLKFYGKYKIQNFGLETEIHHGFGEATVGATPTDFDNWAWMFDLTAGFGKVNAGLLYFYMSGDNDGIGDVENAFGSGGVGNDYNPFVLLTGDWMGLLNADKGGVSAATNTGGKWSGVTAYGLHASMAVSPKLSVSGIIGTAFSDEEPYTTATVTQEDDMGYEINLGASYKLLANLTYGVHFGFLDAGDFWKMGSTTAETNSVYFLANQLVMKF